MRTQVGIIGGGPSGLLLSQLLHLQGIETVVLEKHSREYVLGRIRAGVLEHGFAKLMREAQCGERMDREGQIHEGFYIAHDGIKERVDLKGLTSGNTVIVYGQTELTRDLYDGRDRLRGVVIHDADDVKPLDFDTARPYLTYRQRDEMVRVDCDFIVGCDGFHGVSRKSIPKDRIREYERVYPVRLARRALANEACVAGADLRHARARLRAVLAALADLEPLLHPGAVDGLGRRLAGRGVLRRAETAAARGVAASMITGPSIEKSIAPLRSFVVEPMRHGRMFLAGDAAHIVPPTGARGLNSAASDIYYLYHALVDHYKRRDDRGLDSYSCEGARARLEGAALLVVDDDAAAPLPRQQPVRPAVAANRARLFVLIGEGARVVGRELRRPAVLA